MIMSLFVQNKHTQLLIKFHKNKIWGATLQNDSDPSFQAHSGYQGTVKLCFDDHKCLIHQDVFRRNA